MHHSIFYFDFTPFCKLCLLTNCFINSICYAAVQVPLLGLSIVPEQCVYTGISIQ